MAWRYDPDVPLRFVRGVSRVSGPVDSCHRMMHTELCPWELGPSDRLRLAVSKQKDEKKKQSDTNIFLIVPYFLYGSALPNLVSESWKYAKSGDFCKKKIHIWSVVLRRNRLRGSFFLLNFWKETTRLTYNLFGGRKYDTVFRKKSSLKCLDCSYQKIGLSFCFEDGCPRLTLCTSHRCAKHCCVKALSVKNLRHCYSWF